MDAFNAYNFSERFGPNSSISLLFISLAININKIISQTFVKSDS